MFVACNGSEPSGNEGLTQMMSALSADAGTITISGTVKTP